MMDDGVSALSFSRDSEMIVSGSVDGRIKVSYPFFKWLFFPHTTVSRCGEFKPVTASDALRKRIVLPSMPYDSARITHMFFPAVTTI